MGVRAPPKNHKIQIQNDTIAQLVAQVEHLKMLCSTRQASWGDLPNQPPSPQRDLELNKVVHEHVMFALSRPVAEMVNNSYARIVEVMQRYVCGCLMDFNSILSKRLASKVDTSSDAAPTLVEKPADCAGILDELPQSIDGDEAPIDVT